MIGLGVGIDYALFVVTRHRGFMHEGTLARRVGGARQRHRREPPCCSPARPWWSPSPASCWPGSRRSPSMGYARAITVLVAMVGAVTLLPAFLGLAGTEDRPLPHRSPALGGRRSAAHTHVVGPLGRPRRPPPVALRDRQLRRADGDRRPGARRCAPASPTTARRRPTRPTARPTTCWPTASARASTARSRSPSTAPTAPPSTRPSPTTSATSVAATDGIVFVTEPVVQRRIGDTAVVTAFPATSPQDEETEALVHTLRDDVLPGALSAIRRRRLRHRSDRELHRHQREAGARGCRSSSSPSSALSFLLLMLVFRSVLVPLKAAIMNLLSIGAAYGVVVAVFQWGWGNEPDRRRARPCRSARSCR